jgi:hypothetical protein
MPLLSRSTDDRDARARLEEERRQRDRNPTRRFEYHVLRVGLKVRAEAQINELGEKGWQLVQVVETDGHLAFYFEREIAAPAQAEGEAAFGQAEPEPAETTES